MEADLYYLLNRMKRYYHKNKKRVAFEEYQKPPILILKLHHNF